MVLRAWSIMISCRGETLECRSGRSNYLSIVRCQSRVPRDKWVISSDLSSVRNYRKDNVMQCNYTWLKNIDTHTLTYSHIDTHTNTYTHRTHTYLEICVEDHDLLSWYEEIHFGARLTLPLRSLQWQLASGRTRANVFPLFGLLPDLQNWSGWTKLPV